MFLAMGVGAFGAGIFHLYTHAFFKALLFLASGVVIHALAGEQDMRNMGGLRRALPVTYWTFLIGALAMAGVPGLAGFFSKDEILFRTFANGHQWLWFVGVLTSLLTAVYMFRVVFMTFHGRLRVEPHPPHAEPETGHRDGHPDAGAALGAPAPHLHDAPPAMAIVLVLLAIGSAAAGYIGIPRALGGESAIERFLEPSFTASEISETIGVQTAAEAPQAEEIGRTALELRLMLLSTLVALGGIGIAAFFFLARPEAADHLAERFAGLHRALLHKYYVDEIYDAGIVEPLLRISDQGLWRRIDVRVIDGSVNGVGAIVRHGAAGLRQLQTGSVRSYAAALFVGVVVILGYYVWR